VQSKDLSFFIMRFFTHHLTEQRNASPNTVKAYRNTFILLFTFMSEQNGKRMDKLTISDLSKDTISAFLNWLEEYRKNAITTRNQRLAAIHAFFNYLQAENVDFMLQCKQILSLPFKKHPRTLVHHLEENELKAILQAPDTSTSGGRRDLALLCLLYDTGARVQEIKDLMIGDIRFDSPAIVRLNGKGRKIRAVPLMSRTATLLKNYLDEYNLLSGGSEQVVFFNKQRQKLTRNGIAYIIDKYARQASVQGDMPNFKVTPHVFRHTKAMHLLQSDVNMFYIRDFLGHVDVSTTEIYARLDSEKKRTVLEKITGRTIPDDIPAWQENPTLLVWLKNLGK